MSYELHVGIRRADLPSAQAWQAAMAAMGFPIGLDEFVWGNHSGFLPATLAGTATGFELYLDTLDNVEPPPGVPKHHDAVVSFRVGPEISELKCATCAAAALVETNGGICWDDYSDGLLTNQAWADQLRDVLAAK
jgi:hypothetical protein